jgi:hypothetical protein
MSDQGLRVLCICLSAQYELFSQLESMSSRRRAQQDTSGLEPGALGWSCLCSWRQFSRIEGPGSCPICLGKLISFLVSDLDPTKRQARPTCDGSKSSQPDSSCLFLFVLVGLVDLVVVLAILFGTLLLLYRLTLNQRTLTCSKKQCVPAGGGTSGKDCLVSTSLLRRQRQTRA